MSRKILFLSTSLFCLSLLPGTVFAAGPAPIPFDSLTTLPGSKAIILAKAEKSEKNLSQSAARTAEKKVKTPKIKTDGLTKAAKEPKAIKEPKKPKAAKEVKADKEKKTTAIKDKMSEKAAKDKITDKVTADKHGRRTADTASPRSYQRKKSAATHETTLSQQNRRDGRSFRPISGSENCVCVDGFYCIGPRGGHYCYTSGGNKRYLPRY